MTETTRASAARSGANGEALCAAGFKCRRDGSYRRGPITATRDGIWHTLRAKASRRERADGLLGQPGLWKLVRNADGRCERVFDLPQVDDLPDDAAWADAPDGEDRGESALSLMLEWAAATADGLVPTNWQPPPAETVRRWAAPADLSVRNGGIVRQVEIIVESDRLALRCRVVGVPAELPPQRRAWLDRLALDANDRWRLVRLGWDGDGSDSSDSSGSSNLIAEVDLTGCPAGVLESVFRAALAALRLVVGWLVRAADFLADPACGSALLEAAPSPGPSAVLVPA
jgi:hypothetical protein